MAKLTQRDAIVKALKARGEQEVPSASNRYWVFTRTKHTRGRNADGSFIEIIYNGEPPRSFWMVSKAMGALYLSATDKVKDRIPVNPVTRNVLIEEGGKLP